MVYTTFYNEKTNKFEIAEENCQVKDAKPASFYDQVEVGHFKYEALANASIQMNNHLLENGYLKMIKCKDCKNWFLLNKKSQEFYEENKLKYPARCKKCREIRKQKRANTSNSVSNDKEETK